MKIETELEKTKVKNFIQIQNTKLDEIMSNIDNTFHNDINLNYSMSNISSFGNGDSFYQWPSAIAKPSFDIHKDINTNEQKKEILVIEH